MKALKIIFKILLFPLAYLLNILMGVIVIGIPVFIGSYILVEIISFVRYLISFI